VRGATPPGRRGRRYDAQYPNPERIIARLHELKAGGYPTTLAQVAARVAKPCYRCRHPTWRAEFVWPAGMDEREIKRLANLHRN
jgi:hypothetical protein